MARQRRAPALKALRPHEAKEVLDALLKAHPDLIPEAERLAAGILDDTTWESVREDVTYALLSLPLEALNDRAGYHPGRGYTHEMTATACSATPETWTPTPIPSSHYWTSTGSRYPTAYSTPHAQAGHHANGTSCRRVPLG